MRAYHIAAASVAVCSGLLLASYLKAAEADFAAPVAQMNRAGYDMAGNTVPVFVPARRPHQERRVAEVQMNGGHYAKPAPHLHLPRRPEDERQHMPVVAQSNRILYDR